ncbi:hypothetical protein RHMOL_Rhmol03G0164600 [Rhododendron molle]|uniref:Uncharacterized protein n=1 Tax=Rhododendron molle TaxID=49168 RepID=A0ACC0PGD7_RHOML|nr:hypothetical protein RHMOL_Rhmol03G0164600 [Rhododendron molle]
MTSNPCKAYNQNPSSFPPLASLPFSPTSPPFTALSVAVHAKLKQQKKLEKCNRVRTCDAAEKLALELGEEPPSTMIPRTIENTRELDETVSHPIDEEKEGEGKEEICNYRGVPWRLCNGVGQRL